MGLVFPLDNDYFTSNNFNFVIQNIEMNIIDKIKILWQVRKIYNLIKEVKNMKETKTELWVSLGTQIVALIMMVKGILPTQEGIKIMMIINIVYTAGRSFVKIFKAIAQITPTKKDDEIVGIVEQVLNKIQPQITGGQNK